MFDRCFNAGEYKQAAGIAMETHRLDVLERAIQTSGDPIGMMQYSFGIAMSLISNRGFRDSILTLLARLYSEMPQPDYFKMCQWSVITHHHHPRTTGATAVLIVPLRFPRVLQLHLPRERRGYHQGHHVAGLGRERSHGLPAGL